MSPRRASGSSALTSVGCRCGVPWRGFNINTELHVSDRPGVIPRARDAGLGGAGSG
jgi:hypothetical protein